MIAGADFTRTAIVGKAYFLPHIRSQYTGASPIQLVSECMQRLDLHAQWSKVESYIATLSPNVYATPEIVAVDCLSPSKNRAKIYLRTQGRSFSALQALFTLGGSLNSPSIRESLSCLEHLWRLFFGDIPATKDVLPTNASHYASGFVVYFELSLNRPDPAPKIYIPVRHYCTDDEAIGKALATYYRDIGNDNMASRYLKCIEDILYVVLDIRCSLGLNDLLPSCHRPLSRRTGIHTYVGCAARKDGAQVSIYYSPEAFAPERV